MDRRFIEDSFPVKEVGLQSAREKNIRHGHIANLHMWWARRPLSSSRATNYAALIPTSKDEIEWVKIRNMIIELSKWENTNNKELIDKAKETILKSNNGIKPKVLDPFSGGGAIPLEALRLGCETYANDYNPVAVLIERCSLEFPQKYNNGAEWSDSENILVRDIKKWSKHILKTTKDEIERFYIQDDGSITIGYLWARTIPCQNPSCNSEIPLLKQFWLSNKKNKKIALQPIVHEDHVNFKIVGQESAIPKDFDPSKGTISGAIARCPVCGSSIEAKKTRELFHEGLAKERIIAVVKANPGKKGKIYRIASENDFKIFNESIEVFNEKRRLIIDKWSIDPVPDEKIDPDSAKQRTLWLYGMKKWGDLFNHRQSLALIVFTEKINDLYDYLIQSKEDEEYVKILITYLSFSLDRLISFSTRLCRWKSGSEQNIPIFSGRNAFPMIFDYFEVNPIGDISTNWNSSIKTVMEPLENLNHLSQSITVTNSSATDLKYPDNYFDAVFTDPPYYDNINYAELSDFFYVWLKRTVGKIYPDLFLSPVVPKGKEIVANPSRHRSKDQSKNFFEKMLKKSFLEINRVLKPEGIATIVYAHKTTDGWETVINSILDSGLTVVSSWPLSTEMSMRLNAKRTASLASSIYIICRKVQKVDIGFFKDIRKEIIDYVPKKLDQLWEEGISGADFFIAAIGSAVEIFGKYEKVIDNEGNEIRANKLLSFVRDVVADYTVKQILHDGIADELSPLTKFYLMWRWNYEEARVPFDDARKLAQSAGIDLANEWNKGFIEKHGELITVIGPDKREKKSLKNSKELIDILHLVCILWKEGKNDEMRLSLKKSGFGEGEAIYKISQAISHILSNNSPEKKMIDGFLAGKERIIQDIKEDDSQTKLVR